MEDWGGSEDFGGLGRAWVFDWSEEDRVEKMEVELSMDKMELEVRMAKMEMDVKMGGGTFVFCGVWSAWHR